MIDSITRITLNLQETNTMVSIRAKRGDTGRKLLIHLSDGSIPYHISDDCYATFTAKKPDGTKINNPCTIENNVIEYEFTEQTCTAVGTMKAEIRLYGADDKMITSACFLVNVYDTVFRDGDEVDSEGEMNTLDDLILRANAFLNETGKLLRWQGNWDSESEYEANDLVLHEDVLYVAEEAIAAGTAPGSEEVTAWVPIAGMGTGSGADLTEQVDRAEAAAQNAESAAATANNARAQAQAAANSAGVYVGNAVAAMNNANAAAATAEAAKESVGTSVNLAGGYASTAHSSANRAEQAKTSAQGYANSASSSATRAEEAAARAEEAAAEAGNGSGGNVDLTGYATEQYVQEYAQPKGEYLTEVPEDYAKTEDIPTKPEDIGAQPAGNYLTEVPSGYATEEFVKNKIAEAELGGEEVDLSGYAQKSELPTKVSELKNDAGYLTEHQDLSDYAKKTELPVVPVQSVNGKTGTVKLSASDVGARPNTWMPTAQDVGALPSTYTPPNQTAEQVGADPKGTAANAVSQHNTSDDAHNDIRLELKAISDRLTAFFDSDDQTLDELSEIVSYITNNKTLIESITTSKVSVADIVNNLTSNVSNKPLSAAQGAVLKGLIDTVSNSLANYQPKGNYALRDELPTVPTKVSAFENDKGYLTQHQDISHKLDANKLPEAVNTALAQAKASGEFDGNPGKTAYAYAQEAGYTGTEEEFAEKLAQEPLVGITVEITPSQVMEAIDAGRLVRILYTDKNFGGFYFTSFDINLSLNLIFSSAILQYDGLYAVVELIGDMSTDKWQFIIQQIPIMSDVPTKTSQLTNDSGFLTSAPVTSVNGKTGAVSIDIPTVPSALKNPYALTINGTAYDGSKAVNISIQGGNGDAIPDYVRAEAERVAKVVQSRQNASTLTFITGSDAHLPIPSHSQYQNINNGLIHAGQAMGLLKKQIYTDFSFYAGDMIWDVGETVETAMASMRYVHEVLADGFSGVQFWCRGNHEYGYESGANLTEEQIFANVGKWNTGAVFNPEDRAGGYCYRDIDDYKVRVICINTGDGITNISAKQNAWLTEALNVPVDDGWGTILLSHCPPDWLNGSATESSLLMQTIKAASGIICCIHGHTHCYKIGTVTGTNIPRIAVPNICFTRNNEYGSSGNAFGDTSTVNKTANSANDTAFTVISIDRASGTAYVDYFGARPEDSRTVSGLPTWKTKKIVNQVSISQKKDSNDVYNGTGYKNGAYPSDAGADGTDSATVVTGWIPYNKEVIYVKGATLDTTNSHVRWRSYHANKSDGMYSAGSTIGDYFAIETLGDKYYKLTPKDTITIYDYYRMSFVGTGENLIISHNEPIE